LLQVNNNQGEDEAILEGTFVLTGNGAVLKQAQVVQGDVVDSVFSAENIQTFEVARGNLQGTNLLALSSAGQIGSVLVGQGPSGAGDQNRGNILNSNIRAARFIGRVHADGDILSPTSIITSGLLTAKIGRVSCGGDCSANISSVRIDEILVGYDRYLQKKVEDEDFTGGDFSGTVSAIFGLKNLYVTGRINNAAINANTFSGFGVITSIFAEDGFENTSVSVNHSIRRIMVGYENGRRSRIVNSDANVSGTIRTGTLGRLYYTGTRNVNLSQVRHLGPVIDDVPD